MESFDSAKIAVNSMQRLNLQDKRDNEDRMSRILESLEVQSLDWPEDVPSLVKGTKELQQDPNLRVPLAAPSYLHCEVTSDEFITDNLPWQNGCAATGALNQHYQARVVSVSKLTSSNIEKPKLELIVELENTEEVLYEPGDAFYFVVPNNHDEVDFILERIGLLRKADRKLIVTVDTKTAKRNAARPSYIPEFSTPRYILTFCLDIRRSPGRPLLRALAECTSNDCEKRRILELCSAQGAEEFTKFVRQAGLSITDFLLNFPSCRPTIERLIELLPRLLPRPYSVSSIRELWGKQIRFIFSLMCSDATNGRRYCHYGLSSGWLAALKKGHHVGMFLKEPSRFRLPPPMYQSCNVTSIPLIMICAGTGLAPFLSFLQKLNYLGAQRHKVPRELYFGCRNIKEDCIYHKEIMQFAKDNILSYVSICESQPDSGSGHKRYVQDALLDRGQEISNILQWKNENGNAMSMVYSCCSTVLMSKNVAEAFMQIFNKILGQSKEEAKLFLGELRSSDRYLEDVW